MVNFMMFVVRSMKLIFILFVSIFFFVIEIRENVEVRKYLKDKIFFKRLEGIVFWNSVCREMLRMLLVVLLKIFIVVVRDR